MAKKPIFSRKTWKLATNNFFKKTVHRFLKRGVMYRKKVEKWGKRRKNTEKSGFFFRDAVCIYMIPITCVKKTRFFGQK
jgi:hypothetical protein